ncbi:hypothetical protein F441_15858 [Phytophthora nicotianae CJ01A1]|uniref:Uncharacterized protein n=1 Tax=Phytophthora nicotianae CJ01A1 TaxID=1317063 RepID=W2WDA9_PHYNI|nr:hypothetical protein F441_15858 [Phytophthora nicotianae CJ01A1]
MEATPLVPVVVSSFQIRFHRATMSRRQPRPRGALNHALHRAYDALLPQQRRDPTRLEEFRPVDTGRSPGQPSSAASLSSPSGTSLPMDHEPTPMPAATTAAASSAALQTGTQSSALVPVASPAPAEPSEELTVDSLRDLLAESADPTVDSVRTALLPYLTLMARHQVQLSISPPLQGLRAAEVDLSTLGLDRDTFRPLQQKAGDQEDPFALAEALAKTAQQVQSSASKRSRH